MAWLNSFKAFKDLLLASLKSWSSENSFAVKLLNTKNYVAEGKSKKDAEQNAAIQCLQNIKKIWFGIALVFC